MNISPEDKAIAVINSCTTFEHTEGAQRYITFYFHLTRNFEFFRYLVELLNQKISSI